MTSLAIKRRCHLGQMVMNFPEKCWKYIMQSLGCLFSSLQSFLAIHTFHSLDLIV